MSVGLYAAILRTSAAGVGRVGVVDDPHAGEERQQAGHGQAEAVEHRQEAEDASRRGRASAPRCTPRWSLMMLACVSGTAFGAFSVPLVNSTTAGSCGSAASGFSSAASSSPPKQRTASEPAQQFELADAAAEVFEEHVLRARHLDLRRGRRTPST